MATYESGPTIGSGYDHPNRCTPCLTEIIILERAEHGTQEQIDGSK